MYRLHVDARYQQRIWTFYLHNAYSEYREVSGLKVLNVGRMAEINFDSFDDEISPPSVINF